MTAVPRVRVELAGSGRSNGLYCYLYAARCEIHGWISNAQTWSPALPAEAADHARTCPALRLARLVARMEYRLEGYRRAYQVNRDRGDLHTAAAYRTVIDNITWDLDRLIKETNR